MQKGETPLHYAAQLSKSKVKGNADIDIVKLLLEHGADCTAVTHQVRVNTCNKKAIIPQNCSRESGVQFYPTRIDENRVEEP